MLSQEGKLVLRIQVQAGRIHRVGPQVTVLSQSLGFEYVVIHKQRLDSYQERVDATADPGDIVQRRRVSRLGGISDEAIVGLNIPTGIPLVYEFDASLKPLDHYYLADSDALDAAVGEVKAQAGAG